MYPVVILGWALFNEYISSLWLEGGGIHGVRGGHGLHILAYRAALEISLLTREEEGQEDETEGR